VRYDTKAPFGAAASWDAYDASVANAALVGFFGAAFDGRYAYMVPYGAEPSGFSGLVTRYDTTAPFTAPASWPTFDVKNVSATAYAYNGATFDGRYVYFVPSASSAGLAARYDTQAPFGNVSSWGTFSLFASVVSVFNAYAGAVFDGRYVYFVPSTDDVVPRYDTLAPFGVASSWSTFVLTTLRPDAKGYLGGAFDGRYLYFVPAYGLAKGLVVRYDTQVTFADAAAWSTFDLASKDPNALGYAGATFDGRYIYLAPSGATRGLLARYDTTAPFTSATSWTTFDLAKAVNPRAASFLGAMFDGRYIYLVPYAGQLAVRFDAKTPASMPKLPGFFGSFL
jgi:hypothetical protein